MTIPLRPINKTHFEKFKLCLNAECDKKTMREASAQIWWDSVRHSKYKDKKLSSSINEVDRNSLHEICRNVDKYSNLDCLIAIMAWASAGGLTINNAKNFFNTSESVNYVENLICDMRNKPTPHAEAYEKFHTESKLKYIGIAYYTKLIFFCNQKKKPEYKSYIMDQWLSKSVNLLMRNEDADVIYMTNGSKARDYRDSFVNKKNTKCVYKYFCRSMDKIINYSGLPKKYKGNREMVESALFSHGGKSMGKWREYVQCQYKKHIGVCQK